MKSDSAYIEGIDFLVGVAGEITGTRRPAPVVRPLFGDGSDRKFYRIFCSNRSFVALVSPRTRDSIDENDSYLLIGRHLRTKGIPVPEMLFADAERGRFLLEDAGDVHLQAFARRNPGDLEKTYRRVITLLAGLHRKARAGFDPGFCFDKPIYDAAFIYERELEYFRQRFLNGYLGLEIGTEALRQDFEEIAEAAGAQRMQFVFHRDFQSRNIMVSRNRLWLLDFQGMRFGPPAYDLASLLMDPYVQIPWLMQERLARFYWTAASAFLECSKGEFLRTYAAVRLCRNLQILGAFGFLGVVKGKKQFLQYIPAALAQLRIWLRTAHKERFPRLENAASQADFAIRRKELKTAR